MPVLLPVADAQARLLALAPPLPVETVPLDAAACRWAAAPVVALRTQPSADLSAMDGYAIRFAELPGPWQVVGESAAGRSLDRALQPGEAARIFTGALLPAGADTVMVQEEASVEGTRLTLSGEGPGFAGRNIRRRGLDFSERAALIQPGALLTPARLALAGAAGNATLPVRRRMRVAIAATGDELVEPGAAAGDAQLPETNRLMVRALLNGLPIDFIDLGILPDRMDALTDAFRTLDCDLLITTGGASVGDHDLVRPALEAAGAVIDFWRIALRPGKPMMAGRLGDAVVLGLPGNPVSAFVTALLFARPLIAHRCGAADPMPSTIRVPLGDAIPANGERTDYMRAELRDGTAWAASLQDSGMLSTLARAGCLIVRAPHAPPADAGEIVDVLPLL